jgi:hypothetical protein
MYNPNLGKGLLPPCPNVFARNEPFFCVGILAGENWKIMDGGMP